MRLFVLPAVLAVVAACARPDVVAARQATLALIHVALIDGTGAAARPDMTILVDGDRIAAIGPSATLAVPGGAHVVDGRGAFAVPGLIDAHVHLGNHHDGRQLLRRALAAGVTTVRDMAAPIDDIVRLAREANRGDVELARVVAAGPMLQGPLPFAHPMVRSVASPAEARASVAALRARGVALIKVGDLLPRELYLAVADEARRLGLPIAGHLPIAVGVDEAVRAGQRSIEHLGGGNTYGVLLACSSDEAELRRTIERALADGVAGRLTPDAVEATLLGAALTTRIADSYRPDRAAALAAKLARSGTWQVPTLVALRDQWAGEPAALTAHDLAAGQRLWQRAAALVGELSRRGVRIAAGSDLAWPADRAVAPLHDELVLLVTAGLTPQAALHAATRGAAELLGQLDDRGTLELGKLADIVLLDGDPLADIANTRRIRAVIRGGKQLAR